MSHRYMSGFSVASLPGPTMSATSTQSDPSQPCRRGKASVKKSNRQLESENLRRQKKTLIARINKMSKRFGLDICLQMHGRGKHDLYTSYIDLSWPQGIKDLIVSN